ncbi:FAD binding domain-containing protein [Botrytis cinerea]
MMVAGGRDSLVGIGGLIVGGGYSWFAPQKGFVADTVINFELVVGNGSIINVNATSNSDLFVGLKGGGNNFGIVTRYDMETFPFDKLWGGIMVYPTSTAKAQINFFTNFTNHISDDPKANFLNIWSYKQVSGTQSIFNVIDYVAPVVAPAIYSDALAIPDLVSSTMRITNVSSLTDELSGTSTLDSRYIFVTTTFSNSAEMYETAVNISNKHLEPFKNTTGLVWSILFQPIPLIVSEHSVAAGGNIMGVDRSKDNLTLFLVYVTWLEASDDQKFTDAAYATVEEINAATDDLGVTNPFVYLNYVGKTQNPLAGYGEKNTEKMRALSKKYDPRGTFQKLVKGGFKIPGVETVMD